MVVGKLDAAQVDLVFHALADATRRDILARTLTGEHSVSELARRYPMSFAAVQKHVAVLERAGLIGKERRGREQRVTGRTEVLARTTRLLDELEALWHGRLTRIDDLLGADPTPDDGTPDDRTPDDPREEPR